MDTHRYGISLQVFNLIAHEWVQWTSVMSSWRWEDKISYQFTSNYVLFCLSYKHNSPLLTRKVNFILINENKRIDNPQRKIVNCVGAKAQEEKMCRNTSKTIH